MPTRMPRALYLLAVAVFAMATSEFMLSGLVPDIATDLGVGVPTAGLLTSAFAAGMVVGAPLVAALSRTWPPRAAMVVFLLGFLLVHVAGAVTSSFGVLLATRVLAALANAGFLAVALAVSGRMVGADSRGRALAVLLSGTTVATVLGVPAGALLGALLGWRSTFWAVAVVCALALPGLLLVRDAGVPASTRVRLRSELAVLLRGRVLLVLVLGGLTNAALFGVLTFLAPLVTDAAGLDPLWTPVVLVLLGVGSFLGLRVSGRLSDCRPGLVALVGGPLLLVGWIVTALGAGQPALLVTMAFVQGLLSFAVGGTLIARVLHEAADAPSMSGSYATAALNVGAVLGPVLAGAAYAGSLGTRGPLWVAAAIVAVVLALAVTGRAVLPTGPPLRDYEPGKTS